MDTGTIPPRSRLPFEEPLIISSPEDERKGTLLNLLLKNSEFHIEYDKKMCCVNQMMDGLLALYKLGCTSIIL